MSHWHLRPCVNDPIGVTLIRLATYALFLAALAGVFAWGYATRPRPHGPVRCNYENGPPGCWPPFSWG